MDELQYQVEIVGDLDVRSVIDALFECLSVDFAQVSSRKYEARSFGGTKFTLVVVTDSMYRFSYSSDVDHPFYDDQVRAMGFGVEGVFAFVKRCLEHPEQSRRMRLTLVAPQGE